MIAYTLYASDCRVRREAEALVNDGFEVDFICLKDNGKLKEKIFGVNIIKVNQQKSQSGHKIFYIFSYLEFFVRTLLVTSWYYRKRKYKIVHINNLPDFLVFTALIPKFFGAKIILDIHDPLPETFLSKFEDSKYSFWYSFLLLIERTSIKFADTVITVSEPVKNDILIEHGTPQSKINIVSNFTDQKLFTFNDNYHLDKKIKLIYHGTIAERLGIDNVIWALASMKNRDRFEFNIIGTGDYASKINSLIKKLNLNEIIKFDNQRFDFNQLPKILREFHVGVISYKMNRATNYMLPVKLLEYFALGIPIIAPKTKAISYYFDDSSILYYDPLKPEHISELLESISENPDLLHSIREIEYLNRYKYDWEEQKIKYKNVIYSLMENTNEG